MKYKDWFTKYEDEIYDAWHDQESVKCFSEFCNKSYKEFLESGEE